MPAQDIQNLFNINRIKNQQDLLKILVYFPFGFVLFLFRAAVLLLLWPLLILFTKHSRVRSVLLRCTCFTFGIVIKKNLQNQDKKAKLLVLNHVSILDHIVVESVLSSMQVNTCTHIFAEWKLLSLFRNADREEIMRNSASKIQCYLNADVPVIVFPESDTTNGTCGLLKFSTFPFDVAHIVQPVVMQICPVRFINISPSVIGSSDWCDLFWLLFVPYTVFSLRSLPMAAKMDKEPPEDFSKRIQNVMALDLNIAATEYTSDDKKEFAKRINFQPVVQPDSRTSRMASNSTNRLNKMAAQVKEVLPDVPLSVILQDLRVTKNVDDTIFRLIEGVVYFVPENNSFMSASTSYVSSNGSESTKVEYTDEQNLPSLNTAAEKFEKTPKERMQSYQERKLSLVNAARKRYLQKMQLQT